MKHLSDIELDQEFAVVVKTERKITHEVLLYIQEINRRNLHLSFGYKDLREFLIKRHRYSDGAAWRRINAMQMLTAVPEAKEKIIEGSLNLSQLAVAQTAIYKKQREEKCKVSNEEKASLLKELENKSVEESKVELANTLNVEIKEKKQITYGKEDSVYINLKFTKDEFETVKECLNLLSHQARDHKELYLKLCAKIIKTKTNPKTQKIEGEQIKGDRVTKNKENPNTKNTRMRLPEEVQENKPIKTLIASPSISFNQNQDIKIDGSLSQNEQSNVFRPGRPEKNPLMDGRSAHKEDKTNQLEPRPTTTITHQNFAAKSQRGRYVESNLRTQVFIRDEFMCRFIGEDGHMCGGKMFLQLHHIIPFARGGRHTLENLSLRCRTHNLYEAEKEGLRRPSA